MKTDRETSRGMLRLLKIPIFDFRFSIGDRVCQSSIANRQSSIASPGGAILKLSLCLVLWFAAALIGGCVTVKAQAPKTVGTDSSVQTTPPDGRTSAQIIDDNKALRKRMEGLEKTNQDLETSVKQRQEYLHQLEKQSKEIEKELDK